MMALRKHAAGEHALHLDEVPAPQARPEWVVLDVGYAGICGTDLHIVEDEFPSWPPVTLGHEFMGTVRELGEGVEDWSVGDRVVCEPHSLACTRCHLCRRGLAHLCAHKRSPGWGIDGGFAERVAVPAHLLHAVPDGVDDVAAGLVEPLAIVVTAFERTPVPPGGTVMVIGPGPIGILAALTATAAGAGRVVLVGRRSSAVRLELAAELGLEVWDSAEGDVAAAGLPPHPGPRGRPGGGDQRRRRGRRPGPGQPAPPRADVRAGRQLRTGHPDPLGAGHEPRCGRRLLAVLVLVQLGRRAGPAGPRRGRPAPPGHGVPPDRLGTGLRRHAGPRRGQGPAPPGTARDDQEHFMTNTFDLLGEQPGMLIGGERVTSTSTRPVLDPASGGELTAVPEGTAEHVDAAMAAAVARTAAVGAAQPARARGRADAIITEIERHAEQLAGIVVAEQGKTITEARGEVEGIRAFFDFAASAHKYRAVGEVVAASRPNEMLVTREEPLGVVAAITPWNYPAAIVARKLGPALMAGNAVVLKPSEETPLSALAVARVCQLAGLPDGLVNVVTGAGRVVGNALVTHPRTSMVTLTGSSGPARRSWPRRRRR